MVRSRASRGASTTRARRSATSSSRTRTTASTRTSAPPNWRGIAAAARGREGIQRGLPRHGVPRQPAVDPRGQAEHRLGQDGTLPHDGPVQPGRSRARLAAEPRGVAHRAVVRARRLVVLRRRPARGRPPRARREPRRRRTGRHRPVRRALHRARRLQQATALWAHGITGYALAGEHRSPSWWKQHERSRVRRPRRVPRRQVLVPGRATSTATTTSRTSIASTRTSATSIPTPAARGSRSAARPAPPATRPAACRRSQSAELHDRPDRIPTSSIRLATKAPIPANPSPGTGESREALLDTQPVNQQLYTMICATSIGFNTLDTSSCAQSIFNSSVDVLLEITPTQQPDPGRSQERAADRRRCSSNILAGNRTAAGIVRHELPGQDEHSPGAAERGSVRRVLLRWKGWLRPDDPRAHSDQHLHRRRSQVAEPGPQRRAGSAARLRPVLRNGLRGRRHRSPQRRGERPDAVLRRHRGDLQPHLLREGLHRLGVRQRPCRSRAR